MALQIKAVKAKIKSVGNIKKITRAMEMVSVSKMKKAVASAVGTREYSLRALNLLSALGRENPLLHPLLKNGAGGKTILILVSSNRGLCGGFNVSLSKTALKQIEKLGRDNVDYITIGKNAERFAKKIGGHVLGSFVDIGEDISFDSVGGISKLTLQEFASGKYNNVLLGYNNYVSAIKYSPVIRELLPISESMIKNIIDSIGPDGSDAQNHEQQVKNTTTFLFEPSEEVVLNSILPLLVRVQIYQALLESSASEHSARMFAMKNATENAQRFVEDLTLEFNHARQNGITQEISETAAGANALG